MIMVQLSNYRTDYTNQLFVQWLPETSKVRDISVSKKTPTSTTTPENGTIVNVFLLEREVSGCYMLKISVRGLFLGSKDQEEFATIMSTFLVGVRMASWGMCWGTCLISLE